MLLAAAAKTLTVSLPDLTAGGQDLSNAVKIALVLTVLSLAPAILVSVTSFTRIIIVLGFARHGLGLPQLPPNPVLAGLALLITFYTMAPVGLAVKRQALEPYQRGEITRDEALERGARPIRQFMLANVREQDLRMFLEAGGVQAAPQSPDDIPFTTLVPAFMVSELTTAFTMGFMILIPFLVIDLAVASALMAMGMIVLPPPTVSLPIKVLVFVLADGWKMLVGSLLAYQTYAGGGP